MWLGWASRVVMLIYTRGEKATPSILQDTCDSTIKFFTAIISGMWQCQICVLQATFSTPTHKTLAAVEAPFGVILGDEPDQLLDNSLSSVLQLQQMIKYFQINTACDTGS